MTDRSNPVDRPAWTVLESQEFRRPHYRVYDEDGYAASFATVAPENAALAGVAAYLCDRFRGAGGAGFDSKDLVVLLGPRIVAVVRKGADGGPVVTTFRD